MPGCQRFTVVKKARRSAGDIFPEREISIGDPVGRGGGEGLKKKEDLENFSRSIRRHEG